MPSIILPTNVPLNPPPPGVTPHLAPEAQPVFSSVAFILLGLSIIIFALRMYTRISILHTVGTDDYLLLIALVLAIATTICSQVQTQYGLGKHVWDLPLSDMPMFLKLLTPAMCLYVVSMLFVKLSLLFLYRRVSTSYNRVFTICWWITLTIVIGYSVPITFLTVLNCNPIRATWDVTLIANAKCINIALLVLIHGAFNTLTDLAILALPIPIVLMLEVKTRQKIVLITLFALGSFTCIVSVYRLRRLADNYAPKSSTDDWTNTTMLTTIWSLVELNCAMICASAIALRPLVRKYFRGLITTNSLNSNGGPVSGTNMTRSRKHMTTNGSHFLPKEVALSPMSKLKGRESDDDDDEEEDAAVREKRGDDRIVIKTSLKVSYES